MGNSHDEIKKLIKKLLMQIYKKSWGNLKKIRIRHFKLKLKH